MRPGVPPVPALAPVPVRAPGPVADALTSLMTELSTATPASMPTHQRLDALLQFAPSATAAAKLARIYGSTPPYTFSRQAAGTGGWNYRGVLSPLHFKDQDGSTVDWDAATTDIAVGKDDRSLTVQASWPRLVSADRMMRVSLLDARMSGKQVRAEDGLWFGSALVDIASVNFAPASGPVMAIKDIHIEQAIAPQASNARLAQIDYSMRAARIGFGDEGIDQLHVATRVTGLDRASLEHMQNLSEQHLSAEARKAAMPSMLTALAKGAVRGGTALEIDDLSASFHGQTLRASGRVHLEGATDADAEQLPSLLKKMVARLTVKAPLALVREVANVVATAQLKAKAKDGKPDPQAVAQLAASMNDIFIGKMVSGGFVRLDNDMLVADIELKGGTGLRINGKPVALPTPATAGVPPVASASPQMMQARRVDDRCTLPAYPADVVKADAPLQLSMRLIVKADGSVRNVTLASPSTRPDYDQAVLAAAARCVYIPALRNGQPVDAPVLWKVVREAGTLHP
jgi:TonB family protein